MQDYIPTNTTNTVRYCRKADDVVRLAHLKANKCSSYERKAEERQGRATIRGTGVEQAHGRYHHQDERG